MPEQVIALPSQPNVSSPDRGAFVASREDAPAYWFYGTLWVILADVHQTGWRVLGTKGAQRRERSLHGYPDPHL